MTIQKYLEALKSALRSIRSNKLRSFLTVLGVVIGTFAVIGLVAIVSGLKAEIKTEIVGLGAETIDIVPADAKKSGGFSSGAMLSSFTAAESDAIKRQAQSLEFYSETYQLMGNYSWGKKEESSFLVGITADYFKIRNRHADLGRLFTNADSEKRARVVVIGEGLTAALFGQASPVGKTIKINGTPFEVIGVLEKETIKIGGADINKAAYIPAATAKQTFSEAKIQEIVAKVGPWATVDEAVREVEQILKKERPDKDFSVLTQKDMIALLDRITGMISVALAGIASISLLVGGIGIMNIMLVSVTERTKEIGLRKALGAEDRDILAQFLIEAIVLCLMGGLIGVLVAEAESILVSKYAQLPSMIDLPTILAALGFSITVGLIFGTMPAVKAARLDPIEALRHD